MPVCDNYPYETVCYDCNVRCHHFELSTVKCPQCDDIIRFECGLDVCELSALYDKLVGTGKSARWGLKELGFKAAEPTKVVRDLAEYDLYRCFSCGFWTCQDDLDEGWNCDACTRADY